MDFTKRIESRVWTEVSPIVLVAAGFFKYETAKEYFEPDNHFGPEISEWTCEHCLKKENNGA